MGATAEYFAGREDRYNPEFEHALHRFIAACEHASVLNGDRAARALDALPHIRSDAEFLAVRSLLVELAARSLQEAGVARLDLLLPLIQLEPTGDLGDVFRECVNRARRDCPQDVGDLRVSQALALIANRLTDPALSAAAVASTIGVSASYFAKLLRTHCRCGFRALVRHARLDAARTRLERSLDRIKEVAASVGYTSTSQFDRDFRRAFHVTPRAYRRGHLREAGTSAAVLMSPRLDRIDAERSAGG